jgi:hypothetical protein
MNNIEKAELSWYSCSIDNSDNQLEFLHGIDMFKSSLKREIEKRIKELEINIKSCTYAPEKTILIGRKQECYNNLNLINTVEP